jgi:cytochrome P450
MQATLPPGPRMPTAIQMIGWWTRPIAFMERCRARYGKTYSFKLPGSPPFVSVSTPEDIKEVFLQPPEVLHPGEGAKILEPVVGTYSVILLDEQSHLEQRKLMLPAFHGKKMAELTDLMREVTENEVDKWPRDEATPLHPRLQALTLEIVLRAVFGLDEGERLNRLRALLTEFLEFGANPSSMIPALWRNFPGSKFPKFMEIRDEADEIIFGLIDERRANGGADRNDVMAMLLAARHEDGSPMSHQELRDELVTMLVAGHETTASELAWAFERLSREPRVTSTLTREIDEDGDSDDYLSATVQETLRRRPVLPNAEPRLTKQEVQIGDWLYPEGVSLMANAYLLHHDRDIYEDPYAFKPERFLDEQPGTYTWIPFGGGRRRCIGASFATLEMKLVIKAVLQRAEIRPATHGPELTRRRAITLSPRNGAPTVLKNRVREPVAA